MRISVCFRISTNLRHPGKIGIRHWLCGVGFLEECEELGGIESQVWHEGHRLGSLLPPLFQTRDKKKQDEPRDDWVHLDIAFLINERDMPTADGWFGRPGLRASQVSRPSLRIAPLH